MLRSLGCSRCATPLTSASGWLLPEHLPGSCGSLWCLGVVAAGAGLFAVFYFLRNVGTVGLASWFVLLASASTSLRAVT